MKSKYSYIERFWINKLNSPMAELIMFYGEEKKHIVWIVPMFITSTIIEFLVIYPLIKIEKVIKRIK